MTVDDNYFIDDDQVQLCIRTAVRTLANQSAPEAVKDIVRRCLKDILLYATVIDNGNLSQVKGVISDLLSTVYYIGRYAPTGDLVELVEAFNQQSRGKKSATVRKRSAEQGWKAVARVLAQTQVASGKQYTANGLGGAVIAAWGKRQPRAPDIKTLAPFMTEIAAELDSGIVLKVDGRARKVKK